MQGKDELYEKKKFFKRSLCINWSILSITATVVLQQRRWQLQTDYHDLNFVLYLFYQSQKNSTAIRLLNHNFFGNVALIFLPTISFASISNRWLGYFLNTEENVLWGSFTEGYFYGVSKYVRRDLQWRDNCLQMLLT